MTEPASPAHDGPRGLLADMDIARASGQPGRWRTPFEAYLEDSLREEILRKLDAEEAAARNQDQQEEAGG